MAPNVKHGQKAKRRGDSELSLQLKAWQQNQGHLAGAAPADALGGKGADVSRTAAVRSEARPPERPVPALNDAALFSQAIEAISDSSSAILQKYSREEQRLPSSEPGGRPALDTPEARQIAERALFLQAVGDLNPRDISRAKPTEKRANERSVARFRVRVQREGFFPHASIDLHGDSRERAELRLRNFLQAEQRKRSEIVLVVHGKGLGILANEVRDLLDADPDVAEHISAPAAWGGEGARMVRLKNRRAMLTP